MSEQFERAGTESGLAAEPDFNAHQFAWSEQSEDEIAQEELNPVDEGQSLAADDGLGAQMTVVDHLDELRNRLLRCIAAFCMAFLVSLAFGKHLIAWLEAPAGTKMTFQALSVEEPLLVYFKVSFYAALVLVCPYILFEASMFVAPGLRNKEKRLLMPIVLGSPVLFTLGALFAYYLVLPPMLNFFSAFGQGIAPVQQRLDFYVSLVSTILLYMGLCFQIPIVLFVLSFTGLVTASHLIRTWKYAVFSAAVVAAIITPDPTVLSMLIVMAALLALYFLSVALLKVFRR